MAALRLAAVIISVNWLSVKGIPVDNGVEGNPTIECGVDAVFVKFTTRKPFEGKVFVKNRNFDTKCRRGPSFNDKVDMAVKHLDCGTHRARSLNPAGIEISLTVVISFHHSFVTKVDRAYAISCFYTEHVKKVDARIDVSSQPAESITQTVPMPTCKYEVLRGGPNGSPVRYASIGEPVYHKWSCDASLPGVFCMLVHNCFVQDPTSADKFVLIDDFGCSTDRHLLGSVDYHGPLSAGRESHVFKFADRTQLYFQCQISIVVREVPHSACSRPVCSDIPFATAAPPAPHPSVSRTSGSGVPYELILRDAHPRWQRNAGPLSDQLSQIRSLDVAARRISILELEDDLNDLPTGICPDYSFRDNPWSLQNDHVPYVEVKRGGPSRVCVTTVAFVIVVTATLIVAICTTLALAVAVYRNISIEIVRNQGE